MTISSTNEKNFVLPSPEPPLAHYSTNKKRRGCGSLVWMVLILIFIAIAACVSLFIIWVWRQQQNNKKDNNAKHANRPKNTRSETISQPISNSKSTNLVPFIPRASLSSMQPSGVAQKPLFNTNFLLTPPASPTLPSRQLTKSVIVPKWLDVCSTKTRYSISLQKLVFDSKLKESVLINLLSDEGLKSLPVLNAKQNPAIFTLDKSIRFEFLRERKQTDMIDKFKKPLKHSPLFSEKVFYLPQPWSKDGWHFMANRICTNTFEDKIHRWYTLVGLQRETKRDLEATLLPRYHVIAYDQDGRIVLHQQISSGHSLSDLVISQDGSALAIITRHQEDKKGSSGGQDVALHFFRINAAPLPTSTSTPVTHFSIFNHVGSIKGEDTLDSNPIFSTPSAKYFYYPSKTNQMFLLDLEKGIRIHAQDKEHKHNLFMAKPQVFNDAFFVTTDGNFIQSLGDFDSVSIENDLRVEMELSRKKIFGALQQVAAYTFDSGTECLSYLVHERATNLSKDKFIQGHIDAQGKVYQDGTLLIPQHRIHAHTRSLIPSIGELTVYAVNTIVPEVFKKDQDEQINGHKYELRYLAHAYDPDSERIIFYAGHPDKTVISSDNAPKGKYLFSKNGQGLMFVPESDMMDCIEQYKINPVQNNWA